MRSAPLAAPTPADPVEPAGVRQGRVLLISPQPFYADRGTPIAVRQVLEALSELGYEVDLVTYPIGETVPIEGVSYHRGGNPLRIRSVPIGFSLRKVILDLGLLPVSARLVRSKRYDFIHAVEEAAFPAIWLGRRLQVPVIYDMQSSLPEQLAQRRFFRAPPVALPLAAAERWLLRRAHSIMSSSGLLQHVRSVAPAARTGEWRFVGSAAHPSMDRREVRRSLDISPEAPLVVYAGTFEPYQGVEALLEGFSRALESRREAVLLLIGASDAERRKMRALARSLGSADSVRILPRVTRDKVRDYIAAADVVVSPRSFGANIPLKIFDYLAAGKPILATDIPAHRAVLDETRAHLVPSTVPGLANGIVSLVSDPSRARGLAEAAQRYTETHLGWEAFVRSIDDVYSSAPDAGASTNG
jgi:glycosyltransferase involved in cell wall biosynthesis